MTKLSRDMEPRLDHFEPGQQTRTIGNLLVMTGRLNNDQVDQVVLAQKTLGKRFGDTAVSLGLIKERDLQAALSSQYGYTYLYPGEGNLSEELVAAYKPFSPQAEEIRKLRTELLLRWFNAGHNVLAFTSPASKDGRSYLIANLAVAFAQMRKMTLLVDANMRTPRIHQMFNVSDSVGLSTILSGRASHYDGVNSVVALPGLYVLPAGPIPPNPLELLGRTALTTLLKSLTERYQVVLIDTPCASTSTDASIIAERAGGALVLVRKDVTRTNELKKITDVLAAARTPIVGTVMNRH